ncbi:UDP-N-acetylmuramoyl-L-alanine--D-glutamate ligase [Luteimonas sp. FXH3W]|uniref:UDP-N-acetylmuramoylalanine--D-glutamate ligase n=1 Tax=Aquilutibacter rugosus TaxID=3115820 RepID=A0ABU7V1C8_9GAMM
MTGTAAMPWSADDRIALWGWGHEGRAAYAWIRAREPQRSLQLFVTPAELEAVAAELSDPLVQVSAFVPNTDFSAWNWVIKSPGISPNQPAVQSAIQVGTRFVGGTYLWARAARAQGDVLANTICVTGTKGKSTTSALTAHLLRCGGYRTLLAGNIGMPLLAVPNDATVQYRVIELSSYQTRDLANSGAHPAVAVVVNVFPEHLDWHGGEAQYVADKLTLLTQAAPHVAVINAADVRLTALKLPDSRVVQYGNPHGWHLRDDMLFKGDRQVMDTKDLPLPGRHNRGNLCAALTAIEALGIAAEPLAQHAATFMPLPNRLQTMGTRNGIRYVNDSIATTPHATLAALSCYPDVPVAVIVGGHDRGLDWSGFALAIEQGQAQPAQIVTMGQKGPQIADEIEASCIAQGVKLDRAKDLAQAFAIAEQAVVQAGGGVVLMSPGAPSFDAYRDYVERGKHFAQLAGFDPDRISSIQGLGIA